VDDRRSPPRDPGGGCGGSRRGCEAGQQHDSPAERALPLRGGPRGCSGDGWTDGVAGRRGQGPRRRHRHAWGRGGPGSRRPAWRGSSSRTGRRLDREPHTRRGRCERLRGGPSGRRRVGSRRRLGGDDGDGRQRTRSERPARGADDGRRGQRDGELGRRDRLGLRWSRLGLRWSRLGLRWSRIWGRGCRRRRRAGDRRGRRGQLLDDRFRGRCRRRWSGGQQAERVDVALRFGGDPDAEVEMRRDGDRVGALAHGPDDGALRHDRAAGDAERAELEQRDRVAVRGLDRQRAAASRHGAGERDGAGRGCPHLGAHGRAEVDAAVLPARVGVGGEGERAQQWAVDRPGPGTRGRSDAEQRQHGRGGEDSPHGRPPSLS
jgi:hypothetical protein